MITIVEPEHAHWPLIVMLVLTQLSVGGFAVELAALAAGSSRRHRRACSIRSFASASGWAGLAASVLHLGRPLYAYRALIGLRHSWLSREVLAFGLFATLATVYVGAGLCSGRIGCRRRRAASGLARGWSSRPGRRAWPAR